MPVHGLMESARADLAELVAFRSVAIDDPDHRDQCAQAAAWVADAFASIGFRDVEISPTPDGSSAVHGVAPGPQGAPTVLLYSHYDVQPPLGEAEWRSPVWELSERDGRWYGRGTADCKGNIAMHLLSLRALSEVDGGLPCTVKFICEGSEEQGTGGLEAFVPQNPELLRADAICVVDAGNCAAGVPTLTTCLRGMVMLDVRLDALASVMHSGMYGGPAPDPVAGMIRILASLHDERGNVVVDGLAADGRWEGAQYDADRFRSDATVLDGVELIGSGAVADMLWARPSVTVLGIDVPVHRRVRTGDPGVMLGAREPADPARAAVGGRGGEAHRPSARPGSLGASMHDHPGGERRGIRRLARRPGSPGHEGGDGRRLRQGDDSRRAGRLDTPVQRAAGDLPRRRDHALRRGGAALPDPRPQRERRPFGDRTHRPSAGAVPAGLRPRRRADARSAGQVA